MIYIFLIELIQVFAEINMRENRGKSAKVANPKAWMNTYNINKSVQKYFRYTSLFL